MRRRRYFRLNKRLHSRWYTYLPASQLEPLLNLDDSTPLESRCLGLRKGIKYTVTSCAVSFKRGIGIGRDPGQRVRAKLIALSTKYRVEIKLLREFFTGGIECLAFADLELKRSKGQEGVT